MARQLSDRLRHIRDLTQAVKNAAGPETKKRPAIDNDSNHARRVPAPPELCGGGLHPLFAVNGWCAAGYNVLKRSVDVDLSAAFPALLPVPLAVLIPGFPLPGGGDSGSFPNPERFLFFDLETTGLSGGAGVLAFLAAFGRLLPPPSKSGRRVSAFSKLRITQYLLLDYPGESDFINLVLGEFNCVPPPAAVSFNGKCFDAQILKTRCLMNGVQPPEYDHIDLLHPARRLWKHMLPDCSQGTIEREIVNMGRNGDTPGALAPEIWFSFLKNGDVPPLLGICEHNRRDIEGLAAIFVVMTRIAASPVDAADSYRVDIERLALCWRRFLRMIPDSAVMDTDGPPLESTGDALLRLAVERGCPEAVFVYSLDCLRSGRYGEGRAGLFRITGPEYSLPLRAAALRALVIDTERRLKDPAAALALTEAGIGFLPPGLPRRIEFERRAERLRRKPGLCK
ncbi:MAG: ribonuclease H-like domain-containing protein [Treponema sp.]|nr:ribonuclease H-like domain-containing protein [Treponema sp.]